MAKKLLRALCKLNIVAKIYIVNACMVLTSPLSMMLMKQFLKPSDKNLRKLQKVLGKKSINGRRGSRQQDTSRMYKNREL